MTPSHIFVDITVINMVAQKTPPEVSLVAKGSFLRKRARLRATIAINVFVS
jgi:hypothetical protein